MKTFKSILALAMLIALALPAVAQRSWDTFAAPASVVLAPPAQQAGATSVTNLPTDIKMFDGTSAIYILSVTNGGGTFTATVEQNSTTNIAGWSALTYALATPTTIIYTNTYNGNATNQVGTNYYLLPGVFTTPTAATSGWASTYLLPAQFTNTSAITLPAGGATMIGFNAGDSKRYIHIVFTSTGAGTTNFCGAIMTGFTHGAVNVVQ